MTAVSKATIAKIFEAVVDGDEIETIDPVVRVIIDNGHHHYEFSPADGVRKIEFRERRGEVQP